MSEEVTLEEFAQQGESGEEGQEWKKAQLQDVSQKRSDNVDPQEVDLERHVGLEHINPNDPVPEWEPLDDLSSTKRRFEAGDILFAKLRPNLEKSAQPDFEGVASTDIFPIVADSDVNSKWLLYRLSSKPAYDYARRTSAGTRMPRTSWNLFSNFGFDLPPLSEQRKIATVLHTVDRSIEKTRETVEQMDTVQQGLLRSLFGKESQSQKSDIETKTERLGPKQFQVPVTWEKTEISSIGKVVTGDTPSTDGEGNFGGTLPFVTPETLSQGKYVTESDRTLSEAGQNEAKPIPEGSVMMDCIGSDMGKVAVSGCEVATNQQINSVVIDDESYLPEFLYYHLTVLSDFIESQAGQTATPIVNKSSFASFAIFNPPVEEQQEIVDTLSLYDGGRESNHEYLSRLKRLKRGLMQDLLSGTVRTTEADIDVPDEIAQHG